MVGGAAQARPPPGPLPEGKRRSFRVGPSQRRSAPEGVAAAAVFLASDESSFCAGMELSVDGGAWRKSLRRSPYAGAPDRHVAAGQAAPDRAAGGRRARRSKFQLVGAHRPEDLPRRLFSPPRSPR